MSRSTFKQRQSNRLEWMMQAELAAERLRIENEEAEARLQNALDTIDVVTRATERAFQSVEQQAMREVAQ